MNRDSQAWQAVYDLITTVETVAPLFRQAAGEDWLDDLPAKEFEAFSHKCGRAFKTLRQVGYELEAIQYARTQDTHR